MYRLFILYAKLHYVELTYDSWCMRFTVKGESHATYLFLGEVIAICLDFNCRCLIRRSIETMHNSIVQTEFEVYLVNNIELS